MKTDCLGDWSPEVIETPVTTNSPAKDDQISSRYVTPWFKPFSILHH